MNSKVGSSYGTVLLLGTKVCSCLSVKKETNVSLTLLAGHFSAEADVLPIFRTLPLLLAIVRIRRGRKKTADAARTEMQLRILKE